MDQNPYDKTFYTVQSSGSLQSARLVAPLIYNCFVPRSVCDVGCGVGTWLRAFSELGVVDLVGVDGAWVDRDAFPMDVAKLIPMDLETAFDVGRTFDVAVSLEVAEHLPRTVEQQFISCLVALAPVIVFSAAIPGQGGTNHVNEQRQSHWARLFIAHGYSPYDIVRPKLWDDDRVEPWYRQNTLIYVADAWLREHDRLAQSLSQCQPRWLDVVHPTTLEYALSQIEYALSQTPEQAGLVTTLRKIPGLTRSAVKRRIRGLVDST
jgi:SAM-dependent methyltransferase